MKTRYSFPNNVQGIIEIEPEEDGFYVRFKVDKDNLVPETTPVPKEDKYPFKVGDVIVNEACSDFKELIQLPNEVIDIHGNKSKITINYYRIATPEERAKFMDEKWSRKIGDVKVRAFKFKEFMSKDYPIIITLTFMPPNGTIDDCKLALNIGEALCKALDIPICEGEPVYPL